MYCDRCGTAVAAQTNTCPRCGQWLAAPVGPALPAKVEPGGASAWIGQGWSAMTANFGVFLLLSLIYCLASSAMPVILAGPAAMGLQWAALRQVGGHKAEVNDLNLGFQMFPVAALIALVTSLIVICGMVLLIVPGLIAMLLLQFPYLVAIDQGLDFWGSVKKSVEVSQRYMGRMVALLLLQALVVLGGVLLCGVGVIAALPVVYGSTAAAYIDLFGLQAGTRSRMAARAV